MKLQIDIFSENRIRLNFVAIQVTIFILSFIATSTHVFAEQNLPAIEWNTFLGGSDFDSSTAVAVDGSGNIYVTGIMQTVRTG